MAVDNEYFALRAASVEINYTLSPEERSWTRSPPPTPPHPPPNHLLSRRDRGAARGRSPRQKQTTLQRSWFLYFFLLLLLLVKVALDGEHVAVTSHQLICPLSPTASGGQSPSPSLLPDYSAVRSIICSGVRSSDYVTYNLRRHGGWEGGGGARHCTVII